MQKKVLLVCGLALSLLVMTTAAAVGQNPATDKSEHLITVFIDSTALGDMDFSYSGYGGNYLAPQYDYVGYDPVSGGLMICYTIGYDTWEHLHVAMSADGGTTWQKFDGGTGYDPLVGINDVGGTYAGGAFNARVIPHPTEGPMLWLASKLNFNQGGWDDLGLNRWSYVQSHLYWNFSGYSDTGTGWFMISSSPEGTDTDQDPSTTDDMALQYWRGPLMVSPDDAMNCVMMGYVFGPSRGRGPRRYHAARSTDGGTTWLPEDSLIIQTGTDYAAADPPSRVPYVAEYDYPARYFSGGKVVGLAVCEIDSVGWELAQRHNISIQSDDDGATWTLYMMPSDDPFITSSSNRFYRNYDNWVGDIILDREGNVHHFVALLDSATLYPEAAGPRAGYDTNDIWDLKQTPTGWTSNKVTNNYLARIRLFDIGMDADGDIYIMYADPQDTVAGKADVISGNWGNLRIIISTDNGGTWSSPTQITDTKDINYQFGMAYTIGDEYLYGGYEVEAGWDRDTAADSLNDPTEDQLFFFKFPVSELVTTGVDDEFLYVQDFRLDQNYPNPFNPMTNIRFTLPKVVNVTLKVYNVMGQEVATLINNERHVGELIATWDAKNVASGVYFYTLTAGDFTATKKMLLIK